LQLPLGTLPTLQSNTAVGLEILAGRGLSTPSSPTRLKTDIFNAVRHETVCSRRQKGNRVFYLRMNDPWTTGSNSCCY